MAGVIAHAKSVGATLLEIVRTRLRLLELEIEAHGQRLLVALLLGVAALCLTLFTLMGSAVLLVFMLWQSYGVAVPMALLLGTLGIAIACALLCRRALRTDPRPFAGTLAELDKDIAQLRGGQ